MPVVIAVVVGPFFGHAITMPRDMTQHTQEEDIHPHEKKGAAPAPEEHFQVAPQKGDASQ